MREAQQGTVNDIQWYKSKFDKKTPLSGVLHDGASLLRQEPGVGTGCGVRAAPLHASSLSL